MSGDQRLPPYPTARVTQLTGAYRARHCAGTTFRLRGAIHTMALPGNPRGKRFGASVPVLREAAGVPSAWLQTFNHPSRDHADGATLGRQRRTSRPGLWDARSRGPYPASRLVPRSHRDTIRTATGLKVGPAPPYGRRDARPHNGGPEGRCSRSRCLLVRKLESRNRKD